MREIFAIEKLPSIRRFCFPIAAANIAVNGRIV